MFNTRAYKMVLSNSITLAGEEQRYSDRLADQHNSTKKRTQYT